MCLVLPWSGSLAFVLRCLLSPLIQEHTNYGIAVKYELAVVTFYSGSWWEGDVETCSQVLPRGFLTGAE